jgi:hypothetical protein
MRRHNRYLHGWGVVCGCEVIAAPDVEHPWQVKICAGYLITPRGDEILIPDGVLFDLAEDRHLSYDPCANVVPCPPTSRAVAEDEIKTVYLAVCYDECDVRPVRMHPAGCGCEDAACEYSRIREGFEFIILEDLPDSHAAALETTAMWRQWVEDPSSTPLPACQTFQDGYIVLASITLPDSRDTAIGAISTHGRRILLSSAVIQAILHDFL